MRDVGLDAHWQVILGREEFFNVTKLMHNSLQGDPQAISDQQWEVFEAYNAMNAQSLDGDWDVIIVHDPQPAGLRANAPDRARALDLALPHRPLDAQPGDAGAPAAADPRLRRDRLAPASSTCPTGLDGGVADHPAGDRPAVAEEHGALARGRRLRLRAVRDRRRAPADLPGLAVRPLEGPDGRDRRLPAGPRGDARRPAGAGRLDGHRRSRGLGVLPPAPSATPTATPTSRSSTTSTTSARSRSTPSSPRPTS